MTHQQILAKVANKYFARCIDDEIAYLTYQAMLGPQAKNKAPEEWLTEILPQLLARWNCLLEAPEVSESTVHSTWLAIAITLHKYGFQDKDLTQKAIDAIDYMNKHVLSSDDLFRKSEEIKTFLKSSPEPLKRKPAYQDSVTFFRAEDVISIQYNKHFYVAYVHEVNTGNERPVVEFYDGVFESIPTLDQVKNLKARGRGIEKPVISKFGIYNRTHLPDFANQFVLLASGVKEKPDNSMLEIPAGLYTMSSLYDIQLNIRQLFLLKG
jgi:hypothetical protein